MNIPIVGDADFVRYPMGSPCLDEKNCHANYPMLFTMTSKSKQAVNQLVVN